MTTAKPPVIHDTAIVSPGAAIADSVTIGPYCVIGEQVTLGAGVTLEAHVVIPVPHLSLRLHRPRAPGSEI